MDISRAYEEAKSLPDNILQREVSNPSGGIPGYIALAELAERANIRNTSGSAPRMTLAQKYASRPVGYSAGGIIQSYNPLTAFINAATSPDAARSMGQEVVNERQGGLPSLTPPAALQAPLRAAELSSMQPTQLRPLVTPSMTGGIVGLMKNGR